jgi:hypothetical protein
LWNTLLLKWFLNRGKTVVLMLTVPTVLKYCCSIWAYTLPAATGYSASTPRPVPLNVRCVHTWLRQNFHILTLKVLLRIQLLSACMLWGSHGCMYEDICLLVYSPVCTGIKFLTDCHLVSRVLQIKGTD